MIRPLILAALMLSAPMVAQAVMAVDMVSIARKTAGLHERKHRATLRRMIGVDPARTPWCGAWLGYVARRAGKRPPAGFPSSRAWRTAGRASGPAPGRIVIFRHRHVGLMTGFCRGGVKVISANWRNQVGENCRRFATIRGYRKI
jgi:uncharacterized protein (TIGR02594 family)